jgi:HTH-type transcriptional regulator, sugar sensing transcriptional regulator
LHDRGVDITILVSEDVDTDTLKSLSRVSKVKLKKGLFGGGIISDKRYVVLLLGEELGTSGSKEAVAIWADHSGLAGFAREYFEYLLKESKDVK